MSDTPDTPLTPEDEPTAAEMAAASVMRPMDELPSAWTVKGNPRILATPALTTLSPADQQAVRAAAGSNDPEALDAALLDFLRGKRTEARIKSGAGEGATETEREALDQMNQLRLMGDELSRLDAELAEVASHRTEVDPLTGAAVAVPVYALQGASRTAREARRAEVLHGMALVSGIEGEAAMQRAARSEALKRRAFNAQLEEQREVTRRAHDIAREKRINGRAAAKARMLGAEDAP